MSDRHGLKRVLTPKEGKHLRELLQEARKYARQTALEDVALLLGQFSHEAAGNMIADVLDLGDDDGAVKCEAEIPEGEQSDD